VFGQDIAVALVGRPMPSRLTVDSQRWDDEVIAAILEECPLTRTTTYYFDTSGDDTTGDGTIGDPWETIDKAQEVLTASSGDIALLFARGDVWTEQVGLNVDKSNTTVGAYGTGARPLFNNFGANTFASGGTLWTLASGNRYTTSVAAIGGIREQLNRFKAYRLVASTAEVESTANSYYQTGGTLSIHATNSAGTAVDPDTIAFEYTLAAATDDSGIDVASGVTGVRIDSIRCDGWGLDGTAGNQEYGVRLQTNETDIAAVTNCGAYFNSRHNLGLYTAGASASGGLVLFLGNDFGYCTEASCSPIVFYADNGDQEAFAVGNTCNFGSLPITAARTWADGIAGYAHTDAGVGDTIGLILYRDNVVKAPANGFGCHAGFLYSDIPDVSDPGDCKAITINTTFEKLLGGGANGTNGHQFNTTDSLEIGGTYRLLPRNMATAAMTTTNVTGWMIGTSVEIDLSSYTDDYFSVFNPSGDTSPKYWHTQWNLISNGTTDFTFNFDTVFDGVIATDDGSEFVNSIFAVQRTNPASTADLIRLGLNNTAAELRNNAFFGLSANGTNNSISNAANTVTLDAMPTLGAAVYPDSGQLAGEGEGGVIEFDAAYRSRHPVTPAIGPIEVAAQGVQSPTSAELVAMMEDVIGAGIFTSVSADVVGDSYTWFGKRYRATNIVEVGDNFDGALALKPDINPNTTINTVNSVAITGPADVAATSLRVNRDRTRAYFTMPTMETTGTYTIIVTVTTVDGQTIPTTCTLKVY
jgi:hypothetical protein